MSGIVTNGAQAIPPQVRLVAYWILFVAGGVVATANILDVESMIGVTTAKWNELLTYYSVATGVTAASNVTKQPQPQHRAED